GESASGEASAGPVTVVNSPPAAVAAEVTPMPGRAGQTFRCVVTGAQDPEGDPIATTVVWTQDTGTGPTRIATAPTVSVTDAAIGALVGCDVTLGDGTASTTLAAAPSQRVNATPTL